MSNQLSHQFSNWFNSSDRHELQRLGAGLDDPQDEIQLQFAETLSDIGEATTSLAKQGGRSRPSDQPWS